MKRLKEAQKLAENWQREYNLAIAANRSLSRALDKEKKKAEELELYLFSAVRALYVLPRAKQLGKTEKEITNKVFDCIEVIKASIDKKDIKRIMSLKNKK